MCLCCSYFQFQSTRFSDWLGCWNKATTFGTIWSCALESKKPHITNRIPIIIIMCRLGGTLNCGYWKWRLYLMPHFYIQASCFYRSSWPFHDFLELFLTVCVYAFSIFWRSRSSKCVRALIFCRASSNISRPSSGQSQPTLPFYIF